MLQKQVLLVTAAETGGIESGGAQRHIPLRRRILGVTSYLQITENKQPTWDTESAAKNP